jgi:hypothetical protein
VIHEIFLVWTPSHILLHNEAEHIISFWSDHWPRLVIRCDMSGIFWIAHGFTYLLTFTRIAHIRCEISRVANNVFDGILYHSLDFVSIHVKQQSEVFHLISVDVYSRTCMHLPFCSDRNWLSIGFFGLPAICCIAGSNIGEGIMLLNISSYKSRNSRFCFQNCVLEGTN